MVPYLSHGREDYAGELLWEAADDCSHLSHAIGTSYRGPAKLHDHCDLQFVLAS